MDSLLSFELFFLALQKFSVHSNNRVPTVSSHSDLQEDILFTFVQSFGKTESIAVLHTGTFQILFQCSVVA